MSKQTRYNYTAPNILSPNKPTRSSSLKKGVLPETPWNSCLIKTLNNKSGVSKRFIWHLWDGCPCRNEGALALVQSADTISQPHKHLLPNFMALLLLLGLTQVIPFDSGNIAIFSPTNSTRNNCFIASVFVCCSCLSVPSPEVFCLLVETGFI